MMGKRYNIIRRSIVRMIIRMIIRVRSGVCTLISARVRARIYTRRVDIRARHIVVIDRHHQAHRFTGA